MEVWAEGPLLQINALPSLLQSNCSIFSLDGTPIDTCNETMQSGLLVLANIALLFTPNPGHYDLLYQRTSHSVNVSNNFYPFSSKTRQQRNRRIKSGHNGNGGKSSNSSSININSSYNAIHNKKRTTTGLKLPSISSSVLSGNSLSGNNSSTNKATVDLTSELPDRVTEARRQELDTIMSSTEDNKVIAEVNVAIEVRHIASLKAGQFVMCEIIQAYNHIIASEANKIKPKTVHIFDHVFMEKLLDGRDHLLKNYKHKNVARWLQSAQNDINIFEYERVIAPINIQNLIRNQRTKGLEWEGLHWLGIEIDILNETIWYYDSISNNNLMNKYTKAAMWFVNDQLKIRRGDAYLPSEIERWKLLERKSPQQGYDEQTQEADNNCAAHFLLNTRLIIQGAPLLYSQEYTTNFRYSIAHEILKRHQGQWQQQATATAGLTEDEEVQYIPQVKESGVSVLASTTTSAGEASAPIVTSAATKLSTTNINNNQHQQQINTQSVNPIIQEQIDNLDLLEDETTFWDPSYTQAAQPILSAPGSDGNGSNDISTSFHESGD